MHIYIYAYIYFSRDPAPKRGYTWSEDDAAETRSEVGRGDKHAPTSCVPLVCMVRTFHWSSCHVYFVYPMRTASFYALLIFYDMWASTRLSSAGISGPLLFNPTPLRCPARRAASLVDLHVCVCSYVCMYIYIYIYIHTHVHTYVYIYIIVHTHV